MAYTKREEVIELMRKAKLSGEISRSALNEFCEKNSINFPHWIKDFRSTRGYFNIDKVLGNETGELVMSDMTVTHNSELIEQLNPTVVDASTEESFVPKKFKGYVKFGHYDDIENIIKSGMFYTFYVTGLSGNGKTLMIEEICAQLNRECVRANITIETDEDDLIGGFRLIEGETRWQDGPVITAMKRGALLLLDEVDLGSNKLMCLQPVLEGKPIYIKKINKVVYPAPGFNICATANTKGRGNDSGKYVGTMIMNEAFLERFAITLEQEYPPQETEKQILDIVLKNGNFEDSDFTHCLTRWSKGIRDQFVAGQIDEMISTRRLVHICNAFLIYKDRKKAINLCLNRFGPTEKSSFFDFYTKIDAEINRAKEEEAQRKAEAERERIRKEQLAKMPKSATPKSSPAPATKPVAPTHKYLDLDKEFPF